MNTHIKTITTLIDYSVHGGSILHSSFLG